MRISGSSLGWSDLYYRVRGFIHRRSLGVTAVFMRACVGACVRAFVRACVLAKLVRIGAWVRW